MAKKKINGITIALDADTKGVTSGLKEITTESISVTKELKDVERLLKLNPGNVELLTQQQELLSKQVELTSKKLEGLKGAQEDVEKSFKNGDIGEEQYRAFKREVEATEGALKGFEGKLVNLQVEQDKLAQNTKRLDTLFEATGSEVDDFSDILGTKLVNSIKQGSATSDQLEQAINKIGRASLGADSDIGKMKNALDSIDNGSSINKIKNDLTDLKDEAGNSEKALDDMAEGIAGGNMLEASEVISGVADKVMDIGKFALDSALSIDDATSKFNNAFGLTGEAAEQTKEYIKELYSSGLVDSYEEAAEALRQTKQQITGINDADLTAITKKALGFADTFDTDVNESLRGAQSLINVYGLSAEQAFDLMTVGAQNGLNKTDELGDNLAEYATLFEENGYSASEMFNILQSGLDGGAYNLDKVNDLVKEFGVRISDGTIEKAVGEIGGSFKTLFDEWQARGGTNKELFQEIANQLIEVQDEGEKAGLVSEIFGSLGEDAGYKVIEAMGDTANEINGVKTAYDNVAGASEKLTQQNDAAKWKASIQEFQTALLPIGTDILNALQPVIEVISQIADGFGNLPGPVRTIILVLGGVMVVVALLLPLIASFAVAAGAAGGAMALLTGTLLPIIGIIAGIILAIVGIIAVIKNWGAITDWFSDKWDGLKEWWSDFWGQFDGPMDAAFKIIGTSVKTVTKLMFGSFEDKINAIKDLFKFLKLKFPKIELPPMPHFDLKFGEKSIFGKKIKYPNGLDVKWFADGGILTKPTIFGANGNQLLGGGEAGHEVIAPLDKLMGYIQNAVSSATQPKGDEIHIHLTTYGDIPRTTLESMVEDLVYLLEDAKKRKNPFGGAANA